MPASNVSLNDVVAITLRRGTPISDGQNIDNQQLAILNFGGQGPYALDGVLPVFIAPLLGLDQQKLADQFAFSLDAQLDLGEDGVYDGAVNDELVTWRRYFSVDPEQPEDYRDIGQRLLPGLPLDLYTRESLNIYRSLLGFDFVVNDSTSLDSGKSVVVFGTVDLGYDTETREAFVKEWNGYDVAGFTSVAIQHDAGVEWSNDYSVGSSRYVNPNPATELAFNADLPLWRRLITTVFKGVVHEQGHTLGLTHPGTYNGGIKGISDFLWINDSWDESIMSYAQQPKAYEYFGTGQGFPLLNLTPRTLDLLALDQIYSEQEASNGDTFGTHRAFHGDTVYGFNTNISDDQSIVYSNLSSLYDFRIAATIADGHGNDTIDASGFRYGNTIDLYVMTGEETSSRLSRLNGSIGNLSLAVGTIIENAIGGNRADAFYDNQYNNKLVGNDGDDWFSVSGGRDTIIGGRGSDAVVIQGQEDDFVVNHRRKSKIIVRHESDPDYRIVLKGVEYFSFNNPGDFGLQLDSYDLISRGRAGGLEMIAASSLGLFEAGL